MRIGTRPGVELPGIHQTNPRGTSRVLHRVVFSEDCLASQRENA
jgi:hypothetical protein